VSLAARSLGPYEVVALLGSGGMGDVYRARDPRLERDVAIKVLRGTPGAEAMERFRTEARAVAAITHPNIMAVFDYGEDEGVAYIVYELLEGESLRQRIIRGQVAWRDAVGIAADVATGLAAAHAKGIVHGDVKPENIFITSEGRVTLVDFGLARLARTPQPDAHEQPTEPVDASANIVGTLAYMAPETLRGEPATPASDVFALGCVLYELITGRQAFGTGSPITTITNILSGEPPPMTQPMAEVPPEIDAIVQRCLAKQPSSRFGSARDLALMLRTMTSSSRTRPVAFARAMPRPRWQRVATVALIVVACIATAIVVLRRTQTVRPPAIAVLPFENATRDADAEYIADGLTENLINTLSQVPALSVRARSSVFRFKGKNVTPEHAARELRADLVVTGSVRRRGTLLLVSAELEHPGEKRQLWGASYECELHQLMGIQQEMARAVIRATGVRVSDPARERISAREPRSSEAYEQYLRGRYHLNQRTAESFEKALAYFARAVSSDPTYALAYSGIADCYTLMNGYALRAPSELVPKARAATLRALELDPNLAEAHATLAAIHAAHDYDFRRAETEYRTAIALNPNYATARQWYGGFLTTQGRFDEAMVQLEAARQLDPLSLIIPIQIGLRYYMDRQYDMAIQWFRSVFELSPDFGTAHSYIALAYEGKKMEAESVAEYVRAVRAFGQTDPPPEALQRAFDSGGMRAYKRLQLDAALRQRETQYASAVEIALLCTAVGDHDGAIAWLHRAYEEHAAGLQWIRVEPRFDPLRGDPRFQAMVKKFTSS
jgi:serine/threonine-protein kinase